MSKGKQAAIGAENVAANGYTYVKTSTGWRLKHHLVAEKRDGRDYSPKDWRISFADNDKTNFDPDNVLVAPKQKKNNSTYYKRLQRVEDLMTAFVEDAEDIGEALKDLKGALSDVRASHGFAILT